MPASAITSNPGLIALHSARRLPPAGSLLGEQRIMNAPIAGYSPGLDGVDVIHPAGRKLKIGPQIVGSYALDVAKLGYGWLNLSGFIRAAGLQLGFVSVPAPIQPEPREGHS